MGRSGPKGEPRPSTTATSFTCCGLRWTLRIPNAINDGSPRYEFFAGNDASGNPIWSRDYSAPFKPIAAWNNKMGSSHITYDAPLHKYLLVSMDGKDAWGTMDSYLAESDSITGPYKLITYLPNLRRAGLLHESSFEVHLGRRQHALDGFTRPTITGA